MLEFVNRGANSDRTKKHKILWVLCLHSISLEIRSHLLPNAKPPEIKVNTLSNDNLGLSQPYCGGGVVHQLQGDGWRGLRRAAGVVINTPASSCLITVPFLTQQHAGPGEDETDTDT